MEISKKRAAEIAHLIENEGIDKKMISVRGYGEEDLLIKTAENVDEPKNRNVEILIK